MDPMAGLDGCRKSRPPPTGIRSPDRPARSESLYRLRYPGRNITYLLYFYLNIYTNLDDTPFGAETCSVL